MPERSHICLGAIAGVHGVKGCVKIKCFTQEPLDISAYGPVSTEDGNRVFTVRDVKLSKGDLVIARLEGIADRTQAEKLKGTRLYVARDRLPELEEENWYHADLIGLRAELEDGTEYGVLSALHNFGAGDLVEIKKGDGKTELYAFTREIVPVVEPQKGRIVISPPEDISAQEPPEEKGQKR